MRGESGILTRNNFAGRTNPTRIFADQARDKPMRDGLTCFATPYWHVEEKYLIFGSLLPLSIFYVKKMAASGIGY